MKYLITIILACVPLSGLADDFLGIPSALGKSFPYDVDASIRESQERERYEEEKKFRDEQRDRWAEEDQRQADFESEMADAARERQRAENRKRWGVR